MYEKKSICAGLRQWSYNREWNLKSYASSKRMMLDFNYLPVARSQFCYHFHFPKTDSAIDVECWWILLVDEITASTVARSTKQFQIGERKNWSNETIYCRFVRHSEPFLFWIPSHICSVPNVFRLLLRTLSFRSIPSMVSRKKIEKLFLWISMSPTKSRTIHLTISFAQYFMQKRREKKMCFSFRGNRWVCSVNYRLSLYALKLPKIPTLPSHGWTNFLLAIWWSTELRFTLLSS